MPLRQFQYFLKNSLQEKEVSNYCDTKIAAQRCNSLPPAKVLAVESDSNITTRASIGSPMVSDCMKKTIIVGQNVNFRLISHVLPK